MSKELHNVWVYHPKHEPKMVKSDVAKKMYGQGWKDSPAKCSKK